jgi:peptidoglycan/LPS O-acetylase OafA/YrhL
MAFIACKAINKAAYLILGLFIFGFAVRIFCWMQLVSPLSGSDEFRFAWYKWIYYPTYSRLDGLLAGVGIAALFQFKPKIKYRITGYGNTLFIISGLILVAASFLSSGEPSFNASVFGFPFVSILYGVLVLAALSPSGILYKFHSSITKNIATLSYSIYLTHKALIHLTQELVPKYGIDADSNTSFVLCILVSLLGGWILHQVVERPFMKLRDKMLKKEQVSSNSLVNPVPLQAVKNSDDKQV